MNLEINLCGIKLKNPVIAAAGCFGFGHEYKDFIDLSKIGGISTKGLTLNAKDGNSGIRIYEVTAGIMNSIGLQNPSVATFIEKDLPLMKKYDTQIIANLGGNDISDYVEGAKLLEKTDIPIIELNISCPNVKQGGMAFGIKCDMAYKITKEIRKITNKVLMVKMSPNAENIKDMAMTLVDAGADCLSLVNTFNALKIDIFKRKAVFDNITAGLSGACIKPIALRMIRDVYSVVDVPIVGIGGICNYEDAIEFIMAGASAIQIGSANLINPNIMVEIVDGIEKFMKKENIKDLSEIRGII